MSLSINTNINSLLAQKSLSKTNNSLYKNMAALSTGFKINSASDDAAGVGLASRLSALEQSLMQGKKNTNNGIAVTSGLDSLASSVEDILSRMKELTIQASSGIYNAQDRENANQEYQSLSDEITKISGREINGLSQDSNTILTIASGSESTATNDVAISDLRSETILGPGSNIKTASDAQAAMTAIDDALESVSSTRASYGASINQLEQTHTSLESQIQGTAVVLGSIQNTDFAKETTEKTKNEILQKAKIAMMAQANLLPQAALSLIS